ncbi:MAG: HAD family hydrolase [Promethearchaeota archaeon]
MITDLYLTEKLQSGSLLGVIFDFDGTLLNIVEPLKKAIYEVFTDYDINTDINKAINEVGTLLESVQGYPIPKILLESHTLFKHITFFRHLSFFKKLRIITKIFVKYLDYSRTASFFPGTKELVKNLSQFCDLYIVSHNQSKIIKNHLESERIEKNFKGIYGIDNLNALKPSPETLVPIMKSYNSFQNDKFIIIGDMPTDIELGIEAGFFTIAIANGISKRETLLKCRPNLLVNSISELINLFGFGNKNISQTSLKSNIKIKS